MSAEYEPGTVAVATVRGYPNVRVMRTDNSAETGAEWFSGPLVDDYRYHKARHLTDVRPLVVLDIPERVVAPLVEYLRGVGDQKIAGDRLDLIADQIEAQTKPPKPAEPTGLGAVVEDSEGVLWTRTEHLPNITGTIWTSAFHRTMPDKTETRDYRDIEAVRVVHEGVTQ